MNAIKKSNDLNFRIAVNFLRSPLWGFNAPWLWPKNFMLGLLGGHFSLIVGYMEDKDLVAIQDVNHNYGGIYLIKSQRLYDAVNTYDFSVGKIRGLVAVELNL